MDNTQNDYDSLRRLHNSTSEMAEKLEQENQRLKVENSVLMAKLVNCQKALDINKEIMKNALTEQNKMQIEYGNEIQELRAKIKELEA